jgi:hypothetical protein
MVLCGCEQVEITQPLDGACLLSKTGGPNEVGVEIRVVPGSPGVSRSTGTVYLDDEEVIDTWDVFAAPDTKYFIAYNVSPGQHTIHAISDSGKAEDEIGFCLCWADNTTGITVITPEEGDTFQWHNDGHQIPVRMSITCHGHGEYSGLCTAGDIKVHHHLGVFTKRWVAHEPEGIPGVAFDVETTVLIFEGENVIEIDSYNDSEPPAPITVYLEVQPAE